MKHLITRTLTSFMFAVVGLAVAAPAQSNKIIKVTIPFEFNFADKTFPAGDYTLTQPQQNVLLLRNDRGQVIAQRLVQGVETVSFVDATKVKFANSGDQRTMTEVWQQGQSAGVQLAPTKTQIMVAKHRSTEGRQAAEGSQP